MEEAVNKLRIHGSTNVLTSGSKVEIPPWIMPAPIDNARFRQKIPGLVIGRHMVSWASSSTSSRKVDQLES
jgi:hypothetical protein